MRTARRWKAISVGSGEFTWIPIILTRTTTRSSRMALRSLSKTSWRVRSVLLLFTRLRPLDQPRLGTDSPMLPLARHKLNRWSNFGYAARVRHDGVKILAADAQGRVGVWSTNMRVTAPPVLTTNAADEIGLYGADVSGTITSDGGDGTGVKVLAFFFGTADGGDNPYAWQSQVDLGTLFSRCRLPGSFGRSFRGSTVLFPYRRPKQRRIRWFGLEFHQDLLHPL